MDEGVIPLVGIAFVVAVSLAVALPFLLDRNVKGTQESGSAEAMVADTRKLEAPSIPLARDAHDYGRALLNEASVYVLETAGKKSKNPAAAGHIDTRTMRDLKGIFRRAPIPVKYLEVTGRETVDRQRTLIYALTSIARDNKPYAVVVTNGSQVNPSLSPSDVAEMIRGAVNELRANQWSWDMVLLYREFETVRKDLPDADKVARVLTGLQGTAFLITREFADMLLTYLEFALNSDNPERDLLPAWKVAFARANVYVAGKNTSQFAKNVRQFALFV